MAPIVHVAMCGMVKISAMSVVLVVCVASVWMVSVVLVVLVVLFFQRAPSLALSLYFSYSPLSTVYTVCQIGSRPAFEECEEEATA